MESDAALGRLLSRVAGVAALALGFADGGVSLVHPAASLQRRSGRPTHESLRRLSEELDRQVVDRGLPRVVEDLTELGAGGADAATAGLDRAAVTTPPPSVARTSGSRCGRAVGWWGC